MERILAWTDGSCKNVPDTPQPVGFGCVWEIQDYVVRLGMHGKPGTNNTAELAAVLAALWWISPAARKNVHLVIHADSEYAIGVVTKPWRIKKNPEIIQAIKDLITDYGLVEFVHVKGHEGIWGNEEADRLAGEARLLPDQAKSYVAHASVAQRLPDGRLNELLTSERAAEGWTCQLDGTPVVVHLRPELLPFKSPASLTQTASDGSGSSPLGTP